LIFKDRHGEQIKDVHRKNISSSESGAKYTLVSGITTTSGGLKNETRGGRVKLILISTPANAGTEDTNNRAKINILKISFSF
jgi:hypothetical protein